MGSSAHVLLKRGASEARRHQPRFFQVASRHGNIGVILTVPTGPLQSHFDSTASNSVALSSIAKGGKAGRGSIDMTSFLSGLSLEFSCSCRVNRRST